MKKLAKLFCMAAIAVVAMAFTGCSDDSDSEYVYMSTSLEDSENVLTTQQFNAISNLVKASNVKITGSSLTEVNTKRSEMMNASVVKANAKAVELQLTTDQASKVYVVFVTTMPSNTQTTKVDLQGKIVYDVIK